MIVLPLLFFNNISMTNPTPDYDAEAMYAALLQQIKAGLAHAENVALVGIHSGGAWLAERLAADLQLEERLGFIDISFHRDDYAEKGLKSDVKTTQIPFEVNGATVVLVDDVLYTGRTTRAAINELFDYGRPARVLLAALADRGGRELPVAADFLGATISLPDQRLLVLQQADDGRFSLTVAHV